MLLQLLLEVDEDVHVVLQQLCGQAHGIGRKHCTVGPHFERQLVVVGDLAQTGSFNHVVHTAHRRVNRIHGNKAQSQISIEVLVGGDVTATALEAHFHVELAALRERGQKNVLVQNLDVTVCLDHAGGDHAGLVSAQIKRLGAIARQLERNLFQIQDDVGCVFNHAADRLELVQNAFNADGRNCRALD